jgi:hypothetical protein
VSWPTATPRGLAGGYELWDGLADPHLATAMFAAVRMPELPRDTAVVDGVPVGESVGDGEVVPVGVVLGELVGVGLSVGGVVGVACALGVLGQLALGDGWADPVWLLLGTMPVGAVCPLRVGAWPPPPELPGLLLAGVPRGKSSSTRLSRTRARP